jgi:hypothetical protein
MDLMVVEEAAADDAIGEAAHEVKEEEEEEEKEAMSDPGRVLFQKPRKKRSVLAESKPTSCCLRQLTS